MMEYVIDEISGSNMQYSLSDTMVDLLFDLLAGLIVAVCGMYYLRYGSRDRFVDSLQLDEAKDRVVAAVKRSKEQ